MRGDEKANDLRTAMRLAFYRIIREDGYSAFVMVQHGFPKTAMAVGNSKQQIRDSIFVVWANRVSFGQWSRSIKRRAKGA